MRLATFLSRVSVLSLVPLVFADDPSDVLNLTHINFDSVVKPEPLILVEFFAPWYVSSIGVFSHNLKVFPGADTARISHLIMRKQPPLSRRKTSNSPRLTV
jgi:hypothetical protein